MPFRRRRARSGRESRTGCDYHFLDRAEFERRIEAGEFLEWVDYVGNRYGTLNSEIDRLRAAGKAPLLELETDGALRVQRRVEKAVTIFVTAPVEELERRLRAAGDRELGGDRRANRDRQEAARAPRSSSITSSRTTTESARPTTSAAIIDRKLDGAATMARP